MQENEYGTFQVIEDISQTKIATDKKANVNYWDAIEAEVEDLIKEVAQNGGVVIEDIIDYTLVKEVTELITTKLTEQFGAKFPFVDENY